MRIICTCSRFRNLLWGTRKDLNIGPLTHKCANGSQAVIQGQEHFTKHGLPRLILPVVWKGYNEWQPMWILKMCIKLKSCQCPTCSHNLIQWEDNKFEVSSKDKVVPESRKNVQLFDLRYAITGLYNSDMVQVYCIRLIYHWMSTVYFICHRSRIDSALCKQKLNLFTDVFGLL